MSHLKVSVLIAFGRVLFAVADDMEEILSQDKRNTFTIDPELLLEMTQEMPKIDVENLTVFVDLSEQNRVKIKYSYTKIFA